MNIKGEITSVNLKIYHNASQTGKVAVTLDTENLGRVDAVTLLSLLFIAFFAMIDETL